MKPYQIILLTLAGCGVAIILGTLIPASAQPILISLERSDACERSSNCLPLSALIPLDTTDQKISGKLYDDHRSKPKYKNHYQLYQFKKDQYVVCVECDGVFQDHAKVITIENPKNFTYVKISDHVIANNTFYDYSDRHIDRCHSATVSSNLDLIKDTIYVMGNNCKVESKYKEQNKTVKPYTKMIYCGLECQHQKFMRDAKTKSKSFLIQPDIKLKNQNGKVKVN